VEKGEGKLALHNFMAKKIVEKVDLKITNLNTQFIVVFKKKLKVYTMGNQTPKKNIMKGLTNPLLQFKLF